MVVGTGKITRESPGAIATGNPRQNTPRTRSQSVAWSGVNSASRVSGFWALIIDSLTFPHDVQPRYVIDNLLYPVFNEYLPWASKTNQGISWSNPTAQTHSTQAPHGSAQSLPPTHNLDRACCSFT
jgi:hypothetical protein